MAEAHRVKRDDLKYVRKIGQGGFSTVFEMMWEQEESKRVAVKRLNELDKREVDILLKLQHTNIVQLLGVVDEETDYMLVLEYCDGGSLRSYLDDHSDQPLSPQMFYDWAEQAAKPVKYLKQMHIIHKDIKSSNYLISANSVLKLADFGLAKKIEATIQNATGSATYAYMAPELAKENILSPSYDIFALAVVLWELWTRQVPFKGREHVNIMWIVCFKDQRLSVPSDCPEILTNLMERCWDTKREDRPSIDAVLSTLMKARQLALHVHQGELSAATQGVSDLSLGFERAGEDGPRTEASEIAQSVASEPFAMVESAIIVQPSSELSVDTKEEEHSLQIESTLGSWKFDGAVGFESGDGELVNPCGIVETLDGQIAVAEMLLPKVNFYSKDRSFRFGVNTNKKPDNRPEKTDAENATITVGPDGNIFVADCTYFVKVFEQKDRCRYKGMLLTVSPDDIQSDDADEAVLVSVKVDHKDRLLVGERITKYIGIHKSHNGLGDHIRSISVKIEPLHIACTSKDTIVLSDAREVQVIDYSGDFLYHLSPSDLSPDDSWLPRGIAYHSNMIAVCNYYGKGICCFSLSGKYIGTIATGVTLSRDVTFTENGNKMLISDLGCVQIYVKQ